MSNGINVTRIATPSIKGGAVPLPGNGESAKKDADKYKPVTEHTAVKRTIPVTDYVPPGTEDEPEVAATPAVDAAAEKTRREKWQAAQDAKRKAREAEQIDGAAKREKLAGEALKRGDVGAAAKALGLTVPEFISLTNQGAMGIKPEAEKPKELTPAEAFEADKAKFAKDMADFRAEQAAERNQRAMTSFLDSAIRPVLADKEAYEMIHAAGVADIETYAYQYMNNHYIETAQKDADGKPVPGTGTTLNAKDVLDAIEENLVKNAEATATALKARKKLAKHFAAAGGEEAAEEAVEPAESPTGVANAALRKRIESARATDEEAEADPAQLGEVEAEIIDPEPAKIARGPSGANVRALRGARLTPAQRVEAARKEEEEARAKLFKGARR